MQKLPFLISWCFLTLPLFGQGLRFEYYTMEDGLSSQRGLTTQNCIIQDREGFIWIASFNGVNRLDGQPVKVFSYNPEDSGSIGDNIIATLCEDDEGRIWAGGGDGDIYIFDPATEVFATLERDKIAGLRVGADAYLKKPFNKEELFVRPEKLMLVRKKLQEKCAFAFTEKDDSNKVLTLDDLFLEKLRQEVEGCLVDPHFKVSDLCQAAILSMCRFLGG